MNLPLAGLIATPPEAHPNSCTLAPRVSRREEAHSETKEEDLAVEVLQNLHEGEPLRRRRKKANDIQQMPILAKRRSFVPKRHVPSVGSEEGVFHFAEQDPEHPGFIRVVGLPEDPGKEDRPGAETTVLYFRLADGTLTMSPSSTDAPIKTSQLVSLLPAIKGMQPSTRLFCLYPERQQDDSITFVYGRKLDSIKARMRQGYSS